MKQASEGGAVVVVAPCVGDDSGVDDFVGVDVADA